MSIRLMWSRRIAHWMAAIVMVGTPAAYFAWKMNAPPLVILSVVAIGSPFSFAGAIGGVEFGIYRRGLAKMFTEEAVAEQTRVNLVAYLIGCCLSGPFLFIAIMSSPFPGSSIFDLGPLFQIIGGGYLLLLLWALSRHVQSLRVEAEEKWRGFEPDHSD